MPPPGFSCLFCHDWWELSIIQLIFSLKEFVSPCANTLIIQVCKYAPTPSTPGSLRHNAGALQSFISSMTSQAASTYQEEGNACLTPNQSARTSSFPSISSGGEAFLGIPVGIFNLLKKSQAFWGIHTALRNATRILPCWSNDAWWWFWWPLGCRFHVLTSYTTADYPSPPYPVTKSLWVLVPHGWCGK